MPQPTSMRITTYYSIRSLRPNVGNTPGAAGQSLKAAIGSWVLRALCVLVMGCHGAQAATPQTNAMPAQADSAIAVDHLRDLVLVEANGWTPRGFQFRILLDSAARGLDGSLELAAGDGGLLVTARDVDGIGNDLDLIIKSARSFAPIGVWINNHRGGFNRTDPGVYAPSIWRDPPTLLAINAPDTVRSSFSLLPQPGIHPLGRNSLRGRSMYAGLVELESPSWLARLSTDPRSTRGPPSLT